MTARFADFIQTRDKKLCKGRLQIGGGDGGDEDPGDFDEEGGDDDDKDRAGSGEETVGSFDRNNFGNSTCGC